MWSSHLASAYRLSISQRVHRLPVMLAHQQLTNMRHLGTCSTHRPVRQCTGAVCYASLTLPLQQAPLLGVRWSSGATAASSSTSASSAVVSETTTLLRNLDNGAEIFLVGTAHVSRSSAEEVRELIRVVQPTTVMVELCEQRAERLRSSAKVQDGDFVKGLVKDLLGQLRATNINLPQAFIQFGMQGFYRVLKTLGMDPGLEFKVAMEEAQKLRARIVYGDANVQETMRRISQSLRMQDLLKLVMGGGFGPPPEVMEIFNAKGGGEMGLADKVEAMKTRESARKMVEYLRQVNPNLAKALLDDRDEVMVQCLQGLEGRVVSVVGLAHVDGMQSRWDAWQKRSRQLS